MRPRIYLDNAATSWPKPETVYSVVDRYQRELGAPAGRSTYAQAIETQRIVQSCRKSIAELVGAEDERRIVFTFNGTDSLNHAIWGFLRPGDHVITTVCEHNSVLRPLRFKTDTNSISVSYVACDQRGYVNPDEIRAAISNRTRMIAMIHASNVTGALQPAEEVGRIAAEHGLLYLLDAAQSLGYLSLDVRTIGCHLLAAPGHKGLLGPLGTGILYVSPSVDRKFQPIRQGGTGTQSEDDKQPTAMPERCESGNLNVPGIVGLEAGVRYVRDHTDDCVKIAALTGELLDGLADIPRVHLYGPDSQAPRVGVVSLNLEGYDPQELASLLDSQWSIQTRAGLHCAAKMHAALGTLPGGTLRVSLGHFNSSQDIDALLAALREIAAS